MKNIYKIEDNYGGVIEVFILEHNNKEPEDLIWLHIKRAKSKKVKAHELGFVMRVDETKYIIKGLKKAIKI